MYRKERVDKILKILRETGYVNVKYLCDEIGYSKATVNRDLNFMENQKLIVRSYGGVELVEKQSIPLIFRYHKMKNEKRRICKAAAELVKNGDVIFIDSSSTTEYMSPYLADKSDLTVITSNVAVVTYLGDFSNVKTVCLGGQVIEPPSMLGGDLCVKNAMEYKADKLFFSTQSICDNGELGGGGSYTLLLNVMARNSEKVIYLADHEKVNLYSKNVVMTADSVDVIVTDHIFADDFKSKYNHIEFVEV
ncbi:MAG: DeoR/GlpR transcriptional regulator [Clostridia bacterium]|nr:DeoR/GlpR transcriptional regulator [Clostridia bacterium]